MCGEGVVGCEENIGGGWVGIRELKILYTLTSEPHLKTSIYPPPPLLPHGFQRAHFCPCQSPLGILHKIFIPLDGRHPILKLFQPQPAAPLVNSEKLLDHHEERELKVYQLHAFDPVCEVLAVVLRNCVFMDVSDLLPRPPLTIYSARICLTRFEPRSSGECLWV